MTRQRQVSLSRKHLRGVSFVEMLVMLCIASIILLFMHNIFASGIRQTVKGTGLLVTIKDANDLFSSLRKDLLSSGIVTTRDSSGNAVFFNMTSTSTDMPNPSSYAYPQHVEFSLSDISTATYVMSVSGSGKTSVKRTLQTKGKTAQIRHFAIPKMKLFRALLIIQEHYIKQSPLETRHLFVEIELQDDDIKSSKRAVRLTSFFSPTNLGLSAWNYVFLPP